MITVRFPSGFSVQYNSATNVYRDSAGYANLYVGPERTGWLAHVPLDCIIEAKPPCRTYFAATQNDAVMLEKKALDHKVCLLKRQIARLKKQDGGK